ncbi:MAG: RluA family pseudouridine synthase [Acidimicrobiales bacterium]
MSTEVEVPVSLAGERADRAISLITGRSRAMVAALVEAGRVTVEGRRLINGARRLRAGQRLVLDLPDLPDESLVPDPAVPMDVVFADDEVVVVAKPPGVVVHPGAGQPHGTLVEGLLARFPDLAALEGETGSALRPGIVHRIDRGTSGLLVVARTPRARRSLVAQLQAREVERVYDAVVIGAVEADEGLVDAPLAASRRGPVAVSAAGREARTRYAVVERFGQRLAATRLACRLETGRTHQIRAHMTAIGHPVLGDERYGGRKSPVVGELLDPRRPFLHAGLLGFRHPASGEEMRFTLPLPSDLERALDRLRQPEQP